MSHLANCILGFDSAADQRWFSDNPGRNMRLRWAQPCDLERFGREFRGGYPACARHFVIVWRSYNLNGLLIPDRLNAFAHAFNELPDGSMAEALQDCSDGEIASLLMGILREWGLPSIPVGMSERFRRGFEAA